MHLVSKDGFLNISGARFAQWQNDYPGVDVQKEIDKANDWLDRNPSKRWKTLRGFERWLERASDDRNRKDNKPVYVPPEQSAHPAYGYERNYPRPSRRVLSDSEQERANVIAQRTLGDITASLAELLSESSTEAEDIQPHQCAHTFRPCRYTDWDRCTKCGNYRDQYRPLDHRDYEALRRRK